MFRMGSADKKTRKKRTRKINKPILPSPSSGSSQPTQNALTSFLPDLTPPKSEQEELQELQKMMDAENDSDPPVPSLPKGPNPYLTESCLLCRCKKPENIPKSEAEGGDQNHLPLWVCSDCRKTVEEEDKRAATTMASLLVSMEQDLKLDPPSIPPLEPMTSSPSSPTSSSEPTTPNGTLCNCEACTERRQIEQEQEKESLELQKIWQELRHVVRYVYREAGTGLGEGEGEGSADISDTAQMKEHVHRLAVRDPHQLFQRLESQGREFVIEMKVRLLKQLTAGHKTPPQAKQFVAMLLEEYSNLCTAASTLASFLTELMDHLKRFNLTWELHNKHLFQSIIYTDPVVQNSLPMLITQLRLGAASKEAYHEDTYPNILHKYLKFDDEMSVISVVWRDCEQLIEAYNDEQTALKAKQKMLKEDWEFFKAQRKMLEEKVLKNMPVSQSPGLTPVSSGIPQTSTVAHNLEAQLTETMRNILQGSKTTGDECLCPNCNRKRCPCDECSISHMITCGIINPEVAEQMPAHSTGYPHDPSRYIIDVTPPSMSSTSSSSGSESPITVDPERLTFPFDENFQLAEDIEEIPEDIEGRLSDSPDSDDETTADENDEDTEDDEDDAETDDEDDSAEVKDEGKHVNGQEQSSSSTESAHEGEREQGDGQEKDDSEKEKVLGKPQHEEVPCDCTHCTQASILKAVPAEDLRSLPTVVSPQCQCHACLMQSGQNVPTSLPPQHLPSAPRPAALHLYPHIHGSNAVHPGLQNVSNDQQQVGPMQSLLRPHLYELHGMRQAPPKSFTSMHNKKHSGFSFDVDASSHEHLYNAFGEWDSSPFDTSKLNMFGSAGHKFTPSMTGSEILNPPPPLLTGNPFMNEINGSGCDTSLANLMKTSTVVQHCVSASKPLTTTTVTTSTEITTSVKGLSLDPSNTSVHNSFTDAHNKILKVSKALLNQQQQQHQHGGGNKTKPQSLSPSSQTLQTPSTFTFGLPSPLNKNHTTSPGLGSFSVSTSPTSSYATASSSQPVNSFSLSNAGATPGEFCFKHTASAYSQPSSSFSAPVPSSMANQTISTSAPASTSSSTNHQLKLNPDFIRAAAALQKAISEQNAAQQQQQQQQHNNNIPGMHNVHSGIHNFQNFTNLNLQNFTAGLPQHSILTCTHPFTPTTPNSIVQLAGTSVPSVGMPAPQTTPVGLATSGLKLTNQQFQLPSHMTLPTQPVSSTSAALGVGQQSPHVTSSSQEANSNNNVSVGTSTPSCNDPDCDGHHDNDNDSIDDSCSEKSSSTSTSNQKDGKYCDCCYCEFFGHTTPPTVPPSRNYPEMRERLRKRLKIKNERKKGGNPECLAEKAAAACQLERPKCVAQVHIDTPEVDPLEQKGLDELVKFINGGNDEEQKKSSKAAKRARQKQRKAEERAAKEVAERLRKEAELKAEKAVKAHEHMILQKGKQIKGTTRESVVKGKVQDKNPQEKNENTANSTCKNLNKKKGKHKEKHEKCINASLDLESNLIAVKSDPVSSFKGNIKQTDNNFVGGLNHLGDSKVITNGEVQRSGSARCTSEKGKTKATETKRSTNQDPNQSSVSSQPQKLQPTTSGNAKIPNTIIVNGEVNANKATKSKLKKGKVSSVPNSPRPGSANVYNNNNNKEGLKGNSTTIKPATNHVIQQLPSQPICNSNKSNTQSLQQSTQHNNKAPAQNMKSVVHMQNQANIQMSQQGNSNKPPDNKPIINHHVSPPSQKIQQQCASASNINQQIIPPTAGKSNPRPNGPLNRTILHATRTLTNQAGRSKFQHQGNKISNSHQVTANSNSPKILQSPVPHHLTSVSAPTTPDQGHQRRGPNHNIQPSAQTSTQLNFEQRSVPSTPTKQPPPHQPSMGVQGKSRSEGQLAVNSKENNWPSTPKKNEESHNSSTGSTSKNKKKTRRNKGGEEMVSVDEIFLPKAEPEHGEMDDFERELEEFKRFCNDSKPPQQREKLQVNVNLKDIFSKKKSGLGCV